MPDFDSKMDDQVRFGWAGPGCYEIWESTYYTKDGTATSAPLTLNQSFADPQELNASIQMFDGLSRAIRQNKEVRYCLMPVSRVCPMLRPAREHIDVDELRDNLQHRMISSSDRRE